VCILAVLLIFWAGVGARRRALGAAAA
jgi:hypothetical protein